MIRLITAPFAWLMRLFYSLTGSYGVALILFTLVVKLVMLPFQMKSKKSMVRMGRLADKQKELEKKYANNKMKYQEELQKLYTEEGINPMGGCLWSLIPLPIMIFLYYIIRLPITHFMRLSDSAYEQVKELALSMGHTIGNVGYEQIGMTRFISEHWSAFEGKFDGLMNVDFDFLGLDLTVVPMDFIKNFQPTWPVIGVLAIPVLSGLLSYLMSKVTNTSNGQQQQANMKGVMLMMPLMSVYFGFILPVALGVYFLANSVFSILQEATLGKYFNKKLQAEEDEREAKRVAARQLRMEEAKRQALEEKEHPKPKKKMSPKPAEKKKNPTNEAGRVGERPYARGRSYVPDRYGEEE